GLAMFVSTTYAQTAGGTQIVNQASATYEDGAGNNYSTVSNTVTITVANVSGLRITPDAGTHASIVPGEQNVLYSFRVTNIGNFSDQVRFLASGQSIILTGSASLSRAVIDVNTSGTIDAGDTDILGNAADVLSAAMLQNGFIDVLVEVDVDAGASPGSTVNVQLGDAASGAPTYDNQAADTSANEVRTVSTVSVNGLREARGDISATVDTDALVQLNLTYPTGPVALGSNITYGWEVCNNGLRPANAITLAGAPAGSNSGVFIFAPIPVGTSLATGQTFPAGTLYTVSPIATAPTAATWTTSPPAQLSDVTRVAFNVGASVGIAACSTPINMAVTITTADATLDIVQIGDVFATNTVAGQITDQSGDSVANAGDGNATFDEGNQPGNVDGDGIPVITTLIRIGSVLIGPSASPTAVGPTDSNDDYTNLSVNTGIAGVAFGGSTTAAGTVVFRNTIRNTGNANDTFVISRQSAPASFTVEVSVDGGLTYTVLTTNTVSLAVNFGADADILVRVTAPAGQSVLTAYPSVIRATSTITPAAFNETIDRLYTGALRMTKSYTVVNSTGVGGATDAVPGAVIAYTIGYTNITSTGGTGNGTLTLSNIVITEDGNAAPNTWGATTTHIVGSAADTGGGSITGDSAGSSLLVDTIPTLAPQAGGAFSFQRTIN
ncbi:MAG: hypothetical protein OEM82_03940, partial [Acidobacteriota bacterium]|nr:hypothetical protein [Acidobacteriota bacterium]